MTPKVQVSLLRYVPDRLKPEGGVTLGFILGFDVNPEGFVGLHAWRSLPKEFRERLDPLAAEILRVPFEFLRAEFEQTISEGSPSWPLVLDRLSERNIWSIQITKGRPVAVVGEHHEGDSAQEMFEAAFRTLGREFDDGRDLSQLKRLRLVDRPLPAHLIWHTNQSRWAELSAA